MNKNPIIAVQVTLWMTVVACASSPGQSVPADSGIGDGAPAADALAACGSFELASGGWFNSGLLRGRAWTSVSPGTTISPATFSDLPAGGPLCVQGSVIPSTQGYAWAVLGININGVLRTKVAQDAAVDGGASGEAACAYVPVSDGLILNIRTRILSPLWLCLTGASGKQWCNTDLGKSAFLPWNSFVEESGSREIYANQPLVGIGLTVPDPAGASSTAFDFCLDSIVEAASFCQCPGGACTCPTGTTACGAACVADLSANPDNCGTCGHACASTSACREGQCIDSLFSNFSNPYAVAVDMTNLYVTDADVGTVMKAPLNGGPSVALATGQVNPTFIAVDATNVYWANGGTAASDWADGSIMMVSLAGGTPVMLASAQNHLAAIAVDATNIYWVSGGTTKNQFGDGALTTVPLSGGTPVTLASKQISPYRIAVDGSYVYWINLGTSKFGELVKDGSVMKMALSGGAPTTLASAQPAPLAIAVDATSVYWATSEAVFKVPMAGGTPSILASSQSQPFQIAVDRSSAYWTNSYGGSLVKVPLNGGAPVTLAAGQNYALGIALSTSEVFWVNYDGVGSGGILRMPK
jgi:hypothetical protein